MESVKELYEVYEKYIFKYLYGLTLNYDSAEELTQETFFQVLKSFHRFRGDSHVATWIYKIARNVHSQHCKKRDAAMVSIDEAVPDLLKVDGPEDIFQRKEKQKKIKESLMKIPEKQREVLWLREWQGLSYEEVAIITGHSISWVKVNIHRARLTFKNIYNEGGDLNE